ncbi:MAG: phosphoribosylformimino-5-aminoimidazole carboxamide ribotide isomerase [Candidatus Tokpelaia sp. JSC161]|nr:MAG: phosphoribosylformimino-5-aminoimidazole carboxamide ribotide isomerase [Candidatus Tokpelaia sp. JSC161]
MILYPAIDLKNGKCVRLKKGDMSTAIVYHHDPALQAKKFQDQGFEWLHVVDLDGAFAGKTMNTSAVEEILQQTINPVQLGGGLRSCAHVENWLIKGIARVVFGTIAVRNPKVVHEACRLFPGKIAVSLDARNGMVAVEGWAQTSSLHAIELSQRFEDAGVAAIIYTDIERDGILSGINWDATLELAKKINIPVIASGGLGSFKDIQRMTMSDINILNGVITGRALYEKRINIKQALSTLRSLKENKV